MANKEAAKIASALLAALKKAQAERLVDPDLIADWIEKADDIHSGLYEDDPTGKEIVIKEQNGAWWQETVIDLDELLDDCVVMTENDNGWSRKASLRKRKE
jgi:hypothetical protein